MDASNDHFNHVEEKLLSFMDTGGNSLLSWLKTTADNVETSINGIFTGHMESKQGASELRHIFVALRDKARLNSQTRSHMIFDQLGVTEVSL